VKQYQEVADRVLYPPEKVELYQTHQEPSVTDDVTPEPRPDVLTREFRGLRHELQTLTKGIKEWFRTRKWAEKAHHRRERRRAARQKEVGYQQYLPIGQSGTEEYDRRSSAEGATGRALT
jgi:hypothetical protein